MNIRAIPGPVRPALNQWLHKWNPLRAVSRAFDQRDERQACRRRATLGRRGWLVSWDQEPDGQWRARLSGPDVLHTIERVSRTR